MHHTRGLQNILTVGKLVSATLFVSWQLSKQRLLLHPISIPHLESQALGPIWEHYVFFLGIISLWICLSSYHASTPLPGPIILPKQQSARPLTTHGKLQVSLYICLCVYVFLCSSYASTPACLDPPSFCRSSNQQEHGPLTPSASLSSRTLPLFSISQNRGRGGGKRNSEIFLVMAWPATLVTRWYFITNPVCLVFQDPAIILLSLKTGELVKVKGFFCHVFGACLNQSL